MSVSMVHGLRQEDVPMWRLRATDPSPQNDNRLGQHRGDDRGTIPSCHGCEHLRYYSTGALLDGAIAADAPGSANEAAPAHAMTSRAVMTGEQVMRILDETVDWYRTLGAQQQSATQPSDLLILYANRQIADRVIRLAFELARANAELLSSEAEVAQKAAANAASSPQALQRVQQQLDGRRAEIQAEIAS